MSTLLLINPDSVQAWLYQQELRESGYSVHAATTESQAFSLLKAVNPDVIILDSGPPGSQAAHELAKRLCKISAVPVILSTSTMTIDTQVCRRSGWRPAASVLKSSDLGELMSTIARVLSNEKHAEGIRS